MKQQNLDINKLRVATPCSANWHAMHGSDKVRFCDLCSLNVYNFSEMTTAEVQRLVAKTDGRVCGRIYKRADGTVMTQDCPVGLRTYYKRTMRFAGATLAAILGLFSVSFAQSDSKKDKTAVSASKVKITRSASQNQESSLSGTVLDAMGAVIPNAEITIIKDNKRLTERSNDEGEYKFSSLPTGIYILEAKAMGFEVTKIIKLEIKKSESSQLNIKLKTSDVLVGVIVCAEEPLLDTSPTNTRKITKRMIDNLPY